MKCQHNARIVSRTGRSTLRVTCVDCGLSVRAQPAEEKRWEVRRLRVRDFE